MNSTLTTCLTAALLGAGVAGCTPVEPSARRTSTIIRTDPRPPADTNVILPPIPASNSASIPRDRGDDDR